MMPASGGVSGSAPEETRITEVSPEQEAPPHPPTPPRPIPSPAPALTVPYPRT